MLNRMLKLLVGALALLAFAGITVGAAAEKDKADGVAKTNVLDQVKAFTINNIFNYYGNNGVGSYNTYTGNGGLEFPKGSTKTAIFEDGIVWGGFHMGRANPKVGGSVYRHALQAGRITTPGTAVAPGVVAPNCVSDDPLDPKYRVFRVRPDVGPSTPFADVEASLTSEAALIARDVPGTTAQSLFNDYIKDWNEWPGKGTNDPLGVAPFKDNNGNGTYEPATDVPGQPGADMTMYYVANDNSSSITQNLAGCPPIGVEVHRTFWGYNRSDFLGNVIFASTLLINKSGYPVDSTFMVQWADPDLGDSGDDYAGCDEARSLGFVYNGKPYDATYGTAVPSAGYDFFQGPLVATGNEADSAVFQLKYRHGFKNLGMTTFDFFTQGSALYADPAQGANGDVQWYRLMNGLIASNGAPFINPLTGLPTKFTVNGDPVSGQGWIDGTGGLTPQDRRFCLVTGPFTLANGDTQELVVATLVGLGGDRISSIAVLKWYSDLAQFVYNSLFNIANPPPAPVVNVAALDGEISLSWGDPASSAQIENFSSVGYKFQGYNVYQLPGNSFIRSTAKRLATYDIVDAITTVFDDDFDVATGYILNKPIHFGTDSGLKHNYSTKTDAINSRALANGSPYYFAVTAYSVNVSGKPTQLESSPQVLTIFPQGVRPGTRYSTLGDTVKSVQTVLPGGSVSEGLVLPIIVDPTKLSGHQYKVTFRDEDGTTVWDLLDVTTNTMKITGNPNQSGDDAYPVVDGMLMKVSGPSTPGMKDYAIPSGSRRWTWAGLGAGANWGSEGFNGAIGNAFDQWFSGSSVGYAALRNVLIKLAPVGADGVVADPNHANMSFGYRYMRGATSAPAKPEFAQWIINKNPGYSFQDYTKSVPLAAFNNETTPPTRLMVGYLENNAAASTAPGAVGGLVDGRYWPGSSDSVDNISGNGPREWLFIFNVPYSETPDPTLEADILNTELPIMWFLTVNRRGSALYADGDQFLILASHLNTPNNVFTFTAPAPVVNDAALAAADVDKINVFPNPYIGFNQLEVDKYQRFVRLTHLPQNATIRVFNLAGVLVRTLKKTTAGQFYDWDLRNESGFPVAAGMYVIYVDMPELGKTKILKLGVIPEQQFIDRW